MTSQPAQNLEPVHSAKVKVENDQFDVGDLVLQLLLAEEIEGLLSGCDPVELDAGGSFPESRLEHFGVNRIIIDEQDLKMLRPYPPGEHINLFSRQGLFWPYGGFKFKFL